MLARLGKMLSRFRQFGSAYFELRFQLDQSIGAARGGCSCLRSNGTKFAPVCSTFRQFARQGHLVGTVTGPSGREVPPPRGWRPSILTEPLRELAAPDHSITSLARAS